MAISKKAASKKNINNKTAYLTKRILVRAAKAGSREAAEKTMKTLGYNVIVRKGVVVRKYSDGTIKEIERVKTVKKRVTTKAALQSLLHKEAK
ncbi:MAG TPA: hypothetical protein VK622_16415 [Puia sp.]|nr:hypothetical protein [Puia sp.]